MTTQRPPRTPAQKERRKRRQQEAQKAEEEEEQESERKETTRYHGRSTTSAPYSPFNTEPPHVSSQRLSTPYSPLHAIRLR